MKGACVRPLLCDVAVQLLLTLAADIETLGAYFAKKYNSATDRVAPSDLAWFRSVQETTSLSVLSAKDSVGLGVAGLLSAAVSGRSVSVRVVKAVPLFSFPPAQRAGSSSHSAPAYFSSGSAASALSIGVAASGSGSRPAAPAATALDCAIPMQLSTDGESSGPILPDSPGQLSSAADQPLVSSDAIARVQTIVRVYDKQKRSKASLPALPAKRKSRPQSRGLPESAGLPSSQAKSSMGESSAEVKHAPKRQQTQGPAVLSSCKFSDFKVGDDVTISYTPTDIHSSGNLWLGTIKSADKAHGTFAVDVSELTVSLTGVLPNRLWLCSKAKQARELKKLST